MTFRQPSWARTVKLAGEALIALAHARLILHRTRPKDILHRNASTELRAGRIQPSCDERSIRMACDEVAFIIPRLAKRLPWRTDCLVQALAGQSMLTRRGLASEVLVGTAKHSDGTFEAHAWLSCRDATILGGDISRFDPLLEKDGASPKGT
jgi:hypothetical protein